MNCRLILFTHVWSPHTVQPQVETEESENEPFLDAEEEEEAVPENGYAKLDRASLIKLLEQVKAQIPTKDTHKYSTELLRLDWEKVAFDNFAAKDCKYNFLRLIKQVRKYRTLSEITADALELANNAKATFKVFADVVSSTCFHFLLPKCANFCLKYFVLPFTNSYHPNRKVRLPAS